MSNQFRMRKKIFALILVGALVFSVAAHAVVFAFAPYVGAIVESLVIRSAARQVVSVVGTAANDASWASTFLSWMNASRSIASIVISANNGVSYEISSAPEYASDLTRATDALQWKVVSPFPGFLRFDGMSVDPPNVYYPDHLSAVAAWQAWAYTLEPTVSFSFFYQPADPPDPAETWANYFNLEPYLNLEVAGVLSESKDSIKRIVNFSPDQSDPDWTAEELQTHAVDNVIRFEGIAANAVLDFSSSSTGLVFEYQEQISPTQVRKLVANTDLFIVPVSVASSTYDGVITAPAADPGAGAGTITFPSDYARQGEAATAASTLASRLDVLHGDLSTTTATTDPAVPLVDEMPGWGNTFTDLLSWQLPAHTSICPTPELDLSGVLGAGHTYVMNSHCGLIQDNFGTFNAAMTVVWSMLALFIVLRA